MRGNGFRPHKAQYVNGTPLENNFGACEAVYFGEILKQGSTAGGALLFAGATNLPDFIGYLGTTAGTTGSPTNIPALRITQDIEFIVPCASSATVVSTTNVGNYVAVCTSGTAVNPGSSGRFRISGVYNTSGAAAQYFTGHFVATAATTA